MDENIQIAASATSVVQDGPTFIGDFEDITGSYDSPRFDTQCQQPVVEGFVRNFSNPVNASLNDIVTLT